MLSTLKTKGELFLAFSLCDGIEDKDIKQITTLLENNNADPNVLLPLHGVTPFHLAIGHESKEFAENVVKLFLRHGGDPNVKSCEGMTPLHVAAAWGRTKILHLLLASGGNPLILDDENRSPFHYAFEINCQDSMILLEKYCVQYEDINDAEDENIPKIQIELEKIIINHDDVISEYVPSKIYVTNESQYERDKNTVLVKRTNHIPANILKNIEQIETKKIGANSNSISESPILNTDNITLRQGQSHNIINNAISPISLSNDCNFYPKISNKPGEKILTDRLTNTISSICSKYEKKLSNIKVKNAIKSEKMKNIHNILSQRKYVLENLDSEKTVINSLLLNTSIVSGSPNFKIPIKQKNKIKTLKILGNNKINYNSEQLTLKNIEKNTLSSRIINIKNIENSGSHVPKIKLNRNEYDLKKNARQTPGKTQKFETYLKTDHDNLLSTENIIKHENTSKGINIRNFNSNITRNLYTTYDENCIKNSNLMENNGLECKQLRFRCDYLSSPTKLTKIDLNLPIKLNDMTAFPTSPISSQSTSVSYQHQSTKKKSEFHEENKMLIKLDKICRDGAETPPASISTLVNDSLSIFNISESSSSNNINFTASTINDISDNSVMVIFNERSLKNNTISNKSNCLEICGTSLKSSLRSSVKSFISMDEEYSYVDTEKYVAFMERRLRVLSCRKMIEMNEAMSASSASLNNQDDAESEESSRLFSNFDNLIIHNEFVENNISLRQQLIAFGDNPGPVTRTTYRMYLKRLYKLKYNNHTNFGQLQLQNEINPKLSHFLYSINWMKNLQPYRDLEEEVFREYEIPHDNKQYRGGIAKTSFNYLLLDPRITKDLPRNGRNLSLCERWKIFLNAIFYVGKGKNARPMAHLYESHEIWIGKKPNNKTNKKIQKILSIWRDGKGVICHQIFTHSMQEESFTREAAMIDALGTNHLCNCNRGKYYGLAATMSSKTKMDIGKYSLYKAMEILMNNGERQIFPRNIE